MIFVNLFKETLKNIIDYSNLIYLLVKNDLGLRYKNTILGYAWSLLNPFLILFVYVIVFHYGIKLTFNVENAVIFFLSGIILFNFFSESITKSMYAFSNFNSIIKKNYIPLEVIPVFLVISSFINLLLNFIVLIILSFFLLGYIKIKIIFCFVYLFILFVLSLSICLIVSVAFVFFKDVAHIVGILLNMIFFLTPIIYPLEFLFKNFNSIFLKIIFIINPLSLIFYFFRTCIIDTGLDISLIFILYPVVITLVILFISLIIFNKYKKYIPELV